MKKSLSLVVAAAMTLTTASVAFADTAAPTATDLTSQQKFDALKALGIFSGYPDGTAGLDKEMTRAEFAKVLTKLSQLEENAAAASVYKDVPATHWAVGFVGAVTEAQLMNGLGANKFGPSGQVTIEQIAKVADLVAGVEPVADGEVSGAVSGWAKGYVAAAIKAGLLPELPSYQTNATRDLLVSVTYDLAANELVSVASTKVVDATHIEVTFSDGGVVKKELTTALVANTATKVTVEYNGKSYEVSVTLEALKVTGAKQTGAKAVTVNFNQAASAADKADLTYTLKYSLTSYPVTATYADDNQSVVLSAAYLPAGDYTLSVKGNDDIKLTVEAEKATKLDITAPAIQKSKTNTADQDLGVKLYNQYGEEMTSITPIISAYDVTTAAAGNLTVSNGKANTFNAVLGDSINVTAVVPSAGLSVNKTLKVIDGSAATSIKLGEVKPLTGDSRVIVGKTGYVLPLTLVDQNGQTVKLPAGTYPVTNNSATIGGLYFYVSDTTVINSLTVDSNGVVTFDTTAGTNGGTVYIAVTNAATQATANTSVVVSATASVNQLQLSHPGKPIVQGEEVAFPYTAVDSFGAAITPSASLDLSKVNFVAPGLATGYPKLNAKGELLFKFTQSGNFTVYVYVNGVLQPTNVQVAVNDPYYFTAVNGIKDVNTTLEAGAKVDFDADNINLIDNYGRLNPAAVDLSKVTVTPSDTGIVTWSGTQLVAGTKTGSTTVTVRSTQASGNQGTNAVSDYTFTVTVIAHDDIKSYAIDTIGTAKDVDGVSGNYNKTVTLIGKTASGVNVALKESTPTFVTSSDESVLKVVADNAVAGNAPGKSTVAAYFNNTKVAEQEVTVSDAASVVASVAFGASEYDTTKADGKTFNFSVVGTDKDITVKDQYGVVIPATFQILSSNTDVVASTTGNTSTGSVALNIKAVGSVTLTFVASNGTSATAILNVNS